MVGEELCFGSIVLRQPAGLVQQLSHSDLGRQRPVAGGEPWHVPNHGGIQGQRARLHQLHHRHRREGLAQRRQQHRCLRGQRQVVVSGGAERRQMLDLAVADNRKFYSRQVKRLPCLGQIGVNAGIQVG